MLKALSAKLSSGEADVAHLNEELRQGRTPLIEYCCEFAKRNSFLFYFRSCFLYRTPAFVQWLLMKMLETWITRKNVTDTHRDNTSSTQLSTKSMKGTLMQIWKSPCMFVFIWKQYTRNFAFLILRMLGLFAREVSKFLKK